MGNSAVWTNNFVILWKNPWEMEPWWKIKQQLGKCFFLGTFKIWYKEIIGFLDQLWEDIQYKTKQSLPLNKPIWKFEDCVSLEIDHLWVFELIILAEQGMEPCILVVLICIPKRIKYLGKFLRFWKIFALIRKIKDFYDMYTWMSYEIWILFALIMFNLTRVRIY